MKKQLLLIGLVMAMVGVLAFTTGALAPSPVAAAPGNGQGPGGGGGGGDDVTIPDYGDLIILYRDADGVPIPSDPVDVLDPSTEDPDDTVWGGQCWQPIAFNTNDETKCPTECVVATTDPATVAVDQYTCGIATGCSGCTQEVDFGRINEARSSDLVFESQLEDVVTKLAIADGTSLDPAGRMVACTDRTDAGEDDLTATIDSPLQNLAIYRQLMLTGTIGPELPQGAGVLDTAARGLGVASDKGGEVNVDMVAYLNQIMGLTAPEVEPFLPKLCEMYREEVMGTIQLVEKCFLNYGPIDDENPGYGYQRGANFGALPAPAYIGAPTAGWFEYLAVLDPGFPSFQILKGPITTVVFGTDVGFPDGNIGGFAQAADDTRAVINFMHNWPVPNAAEYGTLVTCEDSGVTAYDVSISDVSGLQVPKQMVDGGDGRDFFLTVANAGPDAATGIVTVTALASGGTIEGSPWTFTFTDLAPGTSKSWTEFFSINLGERTTINWTAFADAPDDVNFTNNTVEATTNVKVTGGGGGGGGEE